MCEPDFTKSKQFVQFEQRDFGRPAIRFLNNSFNKKVLMDCNNGKR